MCTGAFFLREQRPLLILLSEAKGSERSDKLSVPVEDETPVATHADEDATADVEADDVGRLPDDVDADVDMTADVEAEESFGLLVDMLDVEAVGTSMCLAC